MSGFKCCLFKLKKDELSSYYISELNNNHKSQQEPQQQHNKQEPHLNNEAHALDKHVNDDDVFDDEKKPSTPAIAHKAAKQNSSKLKNANKEDDGEKINNDENNNDEDADNAAADEDDERKMGDANENDNLRKKGAAVVKFDDNYNKLLANKYINNNAKLKNMTSLDKQSNTDNNNNSNFKTDEQMLSKKSDSTSNPTTDNSTRSTIFKKFSKMMSIDNSSIDSAPSSQHASPKHQVGENKSEQLTSTSTYQQPIYYELEINLKEGKSLAIRDLNGLSDPYAKFLLNGVNVYKSKTIFKNLNPQWNEKFTVKLIPSSLNCKSALNSTSKLTLSPINESLSVNTSDQSSLNLNLGEQTEFFLSKFKLKMFVYDYDRGFLSDDLIGYANIDLTTLKENTETSLELELEDEKISKPEYLGLILLDVNLKPKYTLNEKDLTNASNTNVSGSKLPSSTSASLPKANKRAPYQLWQSVVNIVLIEGSNLISMDDNGFSDPYVKFKLEGEKYRSKTLRQTLNPRYLEQFQFYIYDNDKMNLLISVYDYDAGSSNDDFMGRAVVDLKTYEPEKTHFIKAALEDGAGTISLLLTITGIYSKDTLTGEYDINKDTLASNIYRDDIIRKYGILNSFKEMDNVGWLQVKVIKAEGLASADINGKSDPFVTLQLVNQYVQTHTEYKTLNPEWGKAFEFEVSDIHAVLEVTVLDEDKNKVYEFLGKIEIPIISIQNGKRKVYALKDRKLVSKAKGAIELEMYLIYNPIKAVVRTLNPREEKYITPESKLKIPVLKQNIMRVHNIVQGIINTGNFIDSCFRWADPVRSIIAFLSFIIIVWNFEIYMLPLTLLMIFLKNYLIIKMKAVTSSDEEDINFEFFDEEDETMETEAKDEPKKSFRERLNEIQEICLKVQDTLDYIASIGERIINTFVFTTPWLSWLAIVILLIASLILYLIPFRYLILLWGINKFTKKFRKPPDYVDNTEILDFLSRVPSKKELFYFREFRVEKGHSASIQQSSPKDANVKDKKKKK